MRLAFFLLLCVALPAAAGDVRARIELLSQVDVAAGEVVLGDVARLHAADLGVMRTLVNLPVGRAPRHGEAAVLQRTDLAQWIRRQTGITPDALEWVGPPETRVLPASRVQRSDAALAVARGEWAVLRATEGSITLESRVEVLQDGRAGERIRVRAQGVAGPMFARVVGPGRLELAP